MSETAQLGLPLVQASQAQKHVTVNEALARLDGLTQLVLGSVTVTTPPVATDGAAYGVPAGATGDWAGQEGKIAIWSNGGWVFATPQTGWRGFVIDEGVPVVFGGDWVRNAWAISPNGAASAFHVVEFDHVIGAGSSASTSVEIPQYAMVYAVTGRVITEVTGPTSFEVGVAGATNRYSSGVGLSVGTWFVGITGQPVTYYANTPVVLTATGSDFTGGAVRVALHYYLPSVPNL